jgi:DNA-binding transcriptional LysR family regulator
MNQLDVVLMAPGLRYLLAAAEFGSFSAAARACNVSQPTVSNAIAELEAALGAALFARTTRKLEVTPAGERLLPLARAVQAAVSELERGARTLKSPQRKLLRVGFSQLVGAQRLGLLFEPFAKQHPDVEFIYKECALDDMLARLDANTIDVVCGTGLLPAKNRSRQLLFHEALRWIAPGATATADRVSLREAARTRLLLTDGSCGLAPATRELFARARITIDEYAGRAISYAALGEWAELGLGGAILPASRVGQRPSAALESNGKPVILSYEAVWRKDLLISEHTQAFSQYLRTTVPSLVKGTRLSS